MSINAASVRKYASQYTEELFPLACSIFDKPELGREEHYASQLLMEKLEEKGFTVDKGICGMETAFRAQWERGSGGPTIGFLLEYDALKNLGHACGHHLQGPACVAAGLIIRELYTGPVKLVMYGTPDEEGRGGKIDMADEGCFDEADIVFCYHAASSTGIASANKALRGMRVTFHGTPSHASGSPHLGRSALDAMVLAFHGLEIMREHVKDGSRIHYTITETTGPSNVVHERAQAHITLRSTDRMYLENMVDRAKQVLTGACLMTETRHDIQLMKPYYNLIHCRTLNELVLDCGEELEAPFLEKKSHPSNASSDVGNVSWVVPTANVYTYFCTGKEHSQDWLDAGKTENGRLSMNLGAQMMAFSAIKLLEQPGQIEKIKAEHALLTEGIK